MPVSSSNEIRTGNQHLILNRLLILTLILGLCSLSRCQTYEQAKSILDDKLKNGDYDVDIRPLNDQSQFLYVGVSFVLLSIVEVNQVAQSFISNGFLSLTWNDERLTWKPSDYGGVTVTYPRNVNIWKPRVVLMNTIGKRDIFDDDHAPLTVFNNGAMIMAPGSLFQTSCELDITKFPFDKQRCSINLISMRHRVHEMQFTALNSKVELDFFSPNGEFKVSDTEIVITNVSAGPGMVYSSILINFDLERRSSSLMLNIILPIIFLSFLNLLVFVIPVASGLKIGYGMTGLLTLTVFMSIVRRMMPNSSSKVPIVTVYLFVLLVLSLMTVIQTIIIICLHHKEEKDEKQEKAKRGFKNIFKKVASLRTASKSLNGASNTLSKQGTDNPGSFKSLNENPSFHDIITEEKNSQDQQEEDKKMEEEKGDSNKSKGNKYKTVVKNIDRISFWLFLVLWLACSFTFVITLIVV